MIAVRSVATRTDRTRSVFTDRRYPRACSPSQEAGRPAPERVPRSWRPRAACGDPPRTQWILHSAGTTPRTPTRPRGHRPAPAAVRVGRGDRMGLQAVLLAARDAPPRPITDGGGHQCSDPRRRLTRSVRARRCALESGLRTPVGRRIGQNSTSCRTYPRGVPFVMSSPVGRCRVEEFR